MRCQSDGAPGWKFGKSGACYTYDPDDADSKNAAKKKAIKQAIAIGGGKAPKDLSADERAGLALALSAADDEVEPTDVLLLLAEIAAEEQPERLLDDDSDDLPTVDMEGVEIMSAGGPVYGQGSPKGGDVFTESYLRRLARTNNALADEVAVPNKLGHSKEQKLLRASGLADDEKPAAGWLTNFRVEKRDGVAKLLADVKRVPRTLAKLIKAGAFRKRSVEIARLTAQDGSLKGKRVTAIVGLSWLGAKAPAIRTLKDVVALYAGDDLDVAELLALDEAAEPELVGAFDEWRTADFEVVYAEAKTVWAPGEGFEALRNAVTRALRSSLGLSGSEPCPYWVRDVSDGKALVTKWEEGDQKAWVVPFERGDEGDVSLASRDEWVEATQEWVARSADYTEAAAETSARYEEERKLKTREKNPASGADTWGVKVKLQDLSDEQIAAFAETLGIEEDDETKRRVAVASRLGLSDDEGGDEGDGDSGDDGGDAVAPPAPTPTVALSEAEIAELRVQAAAGAAVAEERRVERRETAISSAIKEGRLNPAQADEWRGFIDATPDLAFKMLSELPENRDLLAVYGQDADMPESTDADEAAYREYAAATGVPYETQEA